MSLWTRCGPWAVSLQPLIWYNPLCEVQLLFKSGSQTWSCCLKALLGSVTTGKGELLVLTLPSWAICP